MQHEIPQDEEQGETFQFANKVRIIENLLVLLNHFFYMYNVVTCVSVGSYPRITEFRDGHSAEKNSFLQ